MREFRNDKKWQELFLLVGFWLARFNRKMSFHFPWVVPLISDRSVWHNGKQHLSDSVRGVSWNLTLTNLFLVIVRFAIGSSVIWCPSGKSNGPFLFVIFINDLPKTVRDETAIALFADDAKCYRSVEDSSDCTNFQHDINMLYDWSLRWGLAYNLDKCVVTRITRKRNSSIPSLATSPYEAGGHALAVVSSKKHLGVIVTDKLTWNSHIECVVAKANWKLGFLRRNCADIGTNSKRTLYLSFVRSHLGCACEVWAPQTTVHHLRILEGVQRRRATRFILNCSYKVSERPDYKSRLKSLKLLPLCYWHEFRDICFFYKCMHKYYNINVSEYTHIITGRIRNAINSNLRPNRVRTSLFRDSFFNHIVPLWNNILLDIRETKALSTFKDRLFNYFFNKFIANFDTSRIQTWKTVCPHCRSINRKNCC